MVYSLKIEGGDAQRSAQHTALTVEDWELIAYGLEGEDRRRTRGERGGKENGWMRCICGQVMTSAGEKDNISFGAPR
jgi:hypothetical protein